MPAGIWKIKRRLDDVQGLEGPRARPHVVVNVALGRQNGAQLQARCTSMPVKVSLLLHKMVYYSMFAPNVTKTMFFSKDDSAELCPILIKAGCTGSSREVETGKKKLQTGFGQFLPVYFRNLLAGIWGSFLRFIETGFINWLAACHEPALTQKVSLRLNPY